MLNEYALDEEDEKIIDELDNLFGVLQNKDVLRNMVMYAKLRHENEMHFGNFNIIIRNNSSYNLMNDYLKVCAKLFVKHNIISTDKIIYLKQPENAKKGQKAKGPFEVELDKQDSIIVVSKNKLGYFDFEREIFNIEKLIQKYPEKIFVFEDTNFCEGQMDAELGNLASWRMTIEKISLDDKLMYCKEMLEKNKIKYKRQDLQEFADQPFWQLKNNILQLIVECKSNEIERVNCEMLRKKSGKSKKIPVRKRTRKIKNKSAKDDLDELIGLDSIKSEINKILNYVKLNKSRGKMPTLHMCFNGNPGTGKTSVARIIGKLFEEERILPGNGEFVEIHGRDLVAKYVGWTAAQVHNTIARAMGGVLFIDEAYSLISDRVGGFEDEAIATLIKEMEDHRDEICIILAGYTDEMKKLIKQNPGFESRIQFTINFPNYTSEELLKIFNGLCKKEKYRLSKGCSDLLLQHFEVARNEDGFGNGRYVRNIFEKIKFEQADRVVSTNSKNVNIITNSDIRNTFMEIELSKPVEEKRRAIGF